jgi:hypothetical protein
MHLIHRLDSLLFESSSKFLLFGSPPVYSQSDVVSVIGSMSLRTLDAIPDVRALYWPRRDDYASFDIPGAKYEPEERSSGSSLLLQLPRELRDMIYVYFLEAHRSAPPSPPFAGPRIFRLEGDIHGQNPQKDIAYPVAITQTNINALLRTSRLIRSEVLELADKRNKNNATLPADLDIMATGYVLYPLWTRLPTLASSNTSLNVTVRLRIFSPEAFRAQDGPPRRPCMASHGFLTLLNQFITCGPAFTRIGKPPDRDSPTVIDTLTVRLVNYDIYTPRMFPPAVHEIVRMCKALSLRADIRPSLRRICVVEEDAERKGQGYAERKWEYDVVSSCDEEELVEMTETWAEMGFALEADAARFGIKGAEAA